MMKHEVEIARLQKAIVEHKQRAADLLINAENLEVALLVLQENCESNFNKRDANSFALEKNGK